MTQDHPEATGISQPEWLLSKEEAVAHLRYMVRGASSEAEPFHEGGGLPRGIVICGGGYRYFTNAYILIRLLRHLECILPIELWGATPDEISPSLGSLLEPYDVVLRNPVEQLGISEGLPLPAGSRWQWLLKPYAIMHSRFTEVIYLDADCFPIRDPSFLFDAPQYVEHGAIFWPDFGVTGPERPIWEVMELPFRLEPEFETGQMVIDKRRCWEPLQLTLWMNQNAALFYQLIWGDKDTFRFAWHKYGRQFAMPPFPVESLVQPGGVHGVMCQHDFSGNLLFQHRNMAKWDLLGGNPRIPGYLYDAESRQYLKELRGVWSGRGGVEKDASPTSMKAGGRAVRSIVNDLMGSVWLYEDRRARSEVCCGPEVAWSPTRISFPWSGSELSAAYAAMEQQDVVTSVLTKGLRCTEISFLRDSIGIGAKKDFYWWGVQEEEETGRFTLAISGESGVTEVFERQPDGSWINFGTEQGGVDGIAAQLYKVSSIYPESFVRRRSTNNEVVAEPLHVANHAFGIGDAITGLYAAVGMAKAGQPVVYHTRHPEWMSRVSYPGLIITSDDPPYGCVDLNADYAEQLRYGKRKARWYAMLALGNPQGEIAGSHYPPARPRVNHAVVAPVLDIRNYVLLAPFASWRGREWPDAHWTRLAFLLGEAGYEVVAMGRGQDAERLRNIFDKSNAYWVTDQSAEWIMTAMLEAHAVISIDSGLIHVAGLLGVAGICIHAHLPADYLFSQAPSIQSLSPATKCTFCRWQPDLGYNEGCAHHCSAIGTISPEAVLYAVQAERMRLNGEKISLLIEKDTAKLSRKGQAYSPLQIRQISADIIAYAPAPDCGMGEAAAMNIRAFQRGGLTVEVRRWEGPDQLNLSSDGDHQVYYHHWHPQSHESFQNQRLSSRYQDSSQYHLAYWACETKGFPASEFVDMAPMMNEIWTPSSFCQTVFSELGKPTYAVPHAVPFADKLELLPSMGGRAPFTVLFIFDSWARFERKNPEGVIRVFQRAFLSRHDVRLVIKAHHLSEEEHRQLSALCKWDSRIRIINSFLTEGELQNLFASADVLLSLQRGEGFGLNLAKALGLGLPVITTGWGGHMDFCSPENTTLVPFHLRPMGEDAQGPMWAEPDESSAVIMLMRIARMVAENDRRLQQMRESGRDVIASNFSEAALQNQVLKRIESALNRVRG